VAITVIIAVRGVVPALIAVKEGTLPVPLAANPIKVLLFVHANVDPGIELVNDEAGIVAPLQTIIFAGTVTSGKGSTFTVALAVLVQLILVAVT
jgi:hypothetical protein